MPGFRGSDSAGSEKDSTEMVFLLWECITALEMQKKFSMIMTKCLLLNQVEAPLATPAKVELE